MLDAEWLQHRIVEGHGAGEILGANGDVAKHDGCYLPGSRPPRNCERPTRHGVSRYPTPCVRVAPVPPEGGCSRTSPSGVLLSCRETLRRQSAINGWERVQQHACTESSLNQLIRAGEQTRWYAEAE